MQKNKLLVLALVALFGATSVFAQSKKAIKSTVKKQIAMASKNADALNKTGSPDSVSVDQFSYALGVAQTAGLKNYLETQLGVDSAYMDEFTRGYSAYMKASPEEAKRLSAYAAGMQIGRQLMTAIIPSMNKQITGNEKSYYLNAKVLSDGLIEGLMNKSKISFDSAQVIVKNQGEYMKFKKKQAAEQFMAENLKKPGIKALSDGIQYRVITEGKGVIPTDTSHVKVNYEGRLIDGKVFDSSYKRNEPATFQIKQVIKGWQIALTKMPVGSTWEIYIPYNLAYGENGNRDIPPYSPLIFKVELLEIVK